MTETPTPEQKAQLELVKLRAEVEKLSAEVPKLRSDNRWWNRHTAAPPAPQLREHDPPPRRHCFPCRGLRSRSHLLQLIFDPAGAERTQRRRTQHPLRRGRHEGG